MSLLHCPHCRLTIRPRATFLAMAHCPRCLARRRVAQPMHPSLEPQKAPSHNGGQQTGHRSPQPGWLSGAAAPLSRDSEEGSAHHPSKE